MKDRWGKSHHEVRDRWSTRAVEWVLFAMAWSFRWLSWPVPTWALTGALAPLGGWLSMVIPGYRKRVEDNLALVWPEKSVAERRRIGRASGAQFTRLMVEYSRLDWFVPRMELSVTGAEHLLAAQEAGKGAILVTAHYGNWEAARFAAMQAGCETGIIYRAFNNRYLDRFTMDLIPCAGQPVLQKGRRGMRDLMVHVADGGFAMVLVDQRNSGAPFIDFLGHPAETVTVAADLARKTGAALIPVRAARNCQERRFDVTFEAPIGQAGAAEMMGAVNNRISAWVEDQPEQWFWFHRRWRRTSRSRADS